jgi:site-specific DNA-cytosine methylase
VSYGLIGSSLVGTLCASDYKFPQNQQVAENKIIVTADGLCRRMTPREYERLQGFPDDWTKTLGARNNQRYKQLGNAITVNVAEWIGQQLVKVEDGQL